MNSTLVHRGPDDAGEYRAPDAALTLAMHRLSILDLASGHQPMSNAQGNLWIVYNGEIFNAPELRTRLERQGCEFKTHNSDTEILLHLYERNSQDMLRTLNGMFAFVIYDRQRNILFGARDRGGIKPFYYSLAASHFAFASEAKALLKLPWLRLEVNEESLFHYVSLRFVPGESSIFRGIRRLPPAHWFKYNLETKCFQQQRYWSLPFNPNPEITAEDWGARIRSGLRDAAKRWTLSDVPVACSLSGGLDSSALVGLLAESGHSGIRTYSLGFTGAGEEAWNELPLARQVARKWGTEHHELVLTADDLLQDLMRMVWSLDEPYGGGLPSWSVFKFMHPQVKVALTGTGGDELFGDYGRYRRLLKTPASGAQFIGKALQNATSVLNRIPDSLLDARRKWEYAHFDEVEQDPFRWYYFNSYYYMPDDVKRSRVFSRAAGTISDTSEVLKRRYEESAQQDPRDALMYLSFNSQLPEEFLLMTDRFSMAHSIEARTPFLDHEFIELVCSIPGRMRTDAHDLKYLLRNSVADLLPSDVLNARKRGFVIPTVKWLRGELRPLVERMLGPDRLRRQGLFNPEFYDLYVKPHLTGQVDFHAEVWTALMFQLWHAVFIEHSAVMPTFNWRDLC